MSDEAKSYNNKFCKQYFSKKSVLQSYFWYIELVFTSSDPATLCHKFDIRCCQSENHSGECVRKWDILHTFTYNIMLRSIDIRPFFPCNFSPKEISEEELRMFDQIKNRDEIIIIEDGFQSVNHEVVALESYI